MKRTILAVVLVLILVLPACGEDDDPLIPAEPCAVEVSPGDLGLRLLFIGNSLTYWFDTPGILAGLMQEAGVDFERIETIAHPNFGLADHWNLNSTHATIAEGWDVVVLQQGASATQGRPSLLEYSALFAEEIRAAGGQPALMMVWPSKSRAHDFDGTSESYALAAEQVNGLLFPCGEAWRAAWAVDPGLEFYAPDGGHPNVLGSYLCALVIFEQLAGRDPRDLPATFCAPSVGVMEMTAERAELVQGAAVTANDEFARTPDTLAEPLPE